MAGQFSIRMPGMRGSIRMIRANGELTAPAGFAFLVDADGAYFIDADGAYLVTAV